MRLLDEPARIVEGSISFRGRDMVHLGDEELREIRGAEIAMVFQDPMTSLNPVLRIARQLIETMTAHRRFGATAARERARDAAAAHGHCDAGARGEFAGRTSSPAACASA